MQRSYAKIQAAGYKSSFDTCLERYFLFFMVYKVYFLPQCTPRAPSYILSVPSAAIIFEFFLPYVPSLLKSISALPGDDKPKSCSEGRSHLV